jgi:DNA-binding transcriptional LysR family regulator
MLNPQRLAILRAVAERGSFTGAADALSYTQSAVSQQISTLERETGAVLIERDRKRARLTEAGEMLVTHANAILGRLEAAERDLGAYREARSGRMRLAAFESAGAAMVPAAVAAFHDRHPGVELSVVQMEPAEATVALESRQLDLAIVYDFAPATGILGAELALTPLFEDRYVAVVPKRHRLARRPEVALGDLAADVWIHPTPRDLCCEIILSACRTAGFEPRVAFEVDEIATTQALVAAGTGVTLLPSLALVVSNPDVAFISLGDRAPVRTVYAALLAASHPTPATSAMLGVLGELGSPPAPVPPSRAPASLRQSLASTPRRDSSVGRAHD